jgi:hypothetical protein
MKKALLVCLLSSLALAAPEKKRSLYDYYLELPPELMGLATTEGKPLDVDVKKRLVKRRDDRNGYLLLEKKSIEAAERDVELALYLRKKSSPLVAMTTELGDRSALRFFTQVDGAWREVTEEVLPKIDDEFLDRMTRKKYPKFPKDRKFSDAAHAIVRYQLPRKGTRIVATSLYEDRKVYGKKIFELHWDGERFVAK